MAFRPSQTTHSTRMTQSKGLKNALHRSEGKLLVEESDGDLYSAGMQFHLLNHLKDELLVVRKDIDLLNYDKFEKVLVCLSTFAMYEKDMENQRLFRMLNKFYISNNKKFDGVCMKVFLRYNNFDSMYDYVLNVLRKSTVLATFFKIEIYEKGFIANAMKRKLEARLAVNEEEEEEEDVSAAESNKQENVSTTFETVEEDVSAAESTNEEEDVSDLSVRQAVIVINVDTTPTGVSDDYYSSNKHEEGVSDDYYSGRKENYDDEDKNYYDGNENYDDGNENYDDVKENYDDGHKNYDDVHENYDDYDEDKENYDDGHENYNEEEEDYYEEEENYYEEEENYYEEGKDENYFDDGYEEGEDENYFDDGYDSYE